MGRPENNNNSNNSNKKLVRLFVAIDMPESLKIEVKKAQEELRELNLFDGRFTNYKDLHLTLNFIGYVDQKLIPTIKTVLKSIKFEIIPVTLGKFGSFGTNGSIRVIWLDLISNNIINLAKIIEKKLSVGTQSMHRDFQSHITVARVKRVKDKDRFKESIANLKAKPIAFDITEFSLKQSTLTSDGPIYVNLETYKAI